MKTLITALILTVTLTFSAYGQFSNNLVSAYNNEVIEAVQGYQIEYLVNDESVEMAIIQANEYLEFSLIRAMIGLIATSNSNVGVYQSWQIDGDNYTYFVVIDLKYLVGLIYMPAENILITAFTVE